MPAANRKEAPAIWGRGLLPGPSWAPRPFEGWPLAQLPGRAGGHYGHDSAQAEVNEQHAACRPQRVAELSAPDQGFPHPEPEGPPGCGLGRLPREAPAQDAGPRPPLRQDALPARPAATLPPAWPPFRPGPSRAASRQAGSGGRASYGQ